MICVGAGRQDLANNGITTPGDIQMNRWIQIPEDVRMMRKDGSDSGVVQNFVLWMTDEVAVDPKLGASFDHLQVGKSVREKFTGKKVGDLVELTEQEWDVVCQVVRSPTEAYSPAGAYQTWSFFEAVFEAPTERPTLKAVAGG